MLKTNLALEVDSLGKAVIILAWPKGKGWRAVRVHVSKSDLRDKELMSLYGQKLGYGYLSFEKPTKSGKSASNK